ncbi:MAG TPA: hypothetical protein VF211_05900 [Burkholderiales bacterium]
MKTLIAALLVAFSVDAFAGEDSRLAVAGRGASLEEAIAAPHARDYRLLVRRSELPRVTARGADRHVRRLLEQARRNGAVLFVCEKDLRAERLRPTDLLPGIVTVDARDVWTNGDSPADRRLRRFCS